MSHEMYLYNVFFKCLYATFSWQKRAMPTFFPCRLGCVKLSLCLHLLVCLGPRTNQNSDTSNSNNNVKSVPPTERDKHVWPAAKIAQLLCGNLLFTWICHWKMSQLDKCDTTGLMLLLCCWQPQCEKSLHFFLASSTRTSVTKQVQGCFFQ